MKTAKKPASSATLTKRGETLQTRGHWQLQTAKARFSEVFRLARNEGPQHISRQGKETVVMISNEQYEELVGRSRQPKSLVKFLRESPLAGLELDLERSRELDREIAF